jgi:hypothetical protein
MSAGVFVAGCVESRAVTVRVRPPPVDAGGPASVVLAQLHAGGERCVALGIAPLGGTDQAPQVSVVRTAGIVASGAPSCFGPSGAVLLRDLVPAASYLLEMVVLEPTDWTGPLDADRDRIVSLQDLPLPNNSEPTYLCLSDPSRGRVWPPILAAAVAACRAAPTVGPCAIPMPYGGVCPIGSR